MVRRKRDCYVASLLAIIHTNMANIQECFNNLQKLKKEKKTIKEMYRDALTNSKSYQEINDQLKELKEKKKTLEAAIRSEFVKEFDKLEEIATEMESESLIMTDLAINKLMKGEEIKITDEYESEYEPLFRVQFKKVK